ncbi:DUF2855 family protein [Oceanicoccus sagamiensis]|uniref:DUF2855 domain-containing protein n=1 Tax=Oceanicoccus sagamiensis TaxID=716816 RepID=A0A1X9NH47_9GAMM|nr:DUF2855 family protein [Oceanicoccus sagamiensis]ARN75722.1 hypothetical protein BST96_17380 [Oceanicoccus sagamiensis]
MLYLMIEIQRQTVQRATIKSNNNEDLALGQPIKRVMLATDRKNLEKTTLLTDELPALADNEIRLSVDKVGLSANNHFYLQMGNAPFLKFFSVYPLNDQYKHLANMPAWGVATIIESANPEFSVGERFRGFLHISNVVQMKAKRSADGFTAYGGKRDKLNQAYNGFVQLKDDSNSPIKGTGDKSDLAMTAAPSALSGFMLYELLKMNDFYQANSVVLTSASSKFSLATALLLQDDRKTGALQAVIGYTAKSNADFVKNTGLYDIVLSYEDDIPNDQALTPVLVDIAGDAVIYKRIKQSLIKTLAVGGTHSNAKASTFTAFGPSGILKMMIDMMAPKPVQKWAAKTFNPPLEMFFAPTVIDELLARWGKDDMEKKSDIALTRFVDAAIDNHWIKVAKSEEIAEIEAAYLRIVNGEVPPNEAVILSLDTNSVV